MSGGMAFLSADLQWRENLRQDPGIVCRSLWHWTNLYSGDQGKKGIVELPSEKTQV